MKATLFQTLYLLPEILLSQRGERYACAEARRRRRLSISGSGAYFSYNPLSAHHLLKVHHKWLNILHKRNLERCSFDQCRTSHLLTLTEKNCEMFDPKTTIEQKTSSKTKSHRLRGDAGKLKPAQNFALLQCNKTNYFNRLGTPYQES